MTNEAAGLKGFGLDDVRNLSLESGKRLGILNLFTTGPADACEHIFLFYAQVTTPQQIGSNTRC